MRKSILACTVSFLMSPMSSWALSMGDIQVISVLNQPLNSEIELNSVTKKDFDTLHVRLAPKSAYTRSDIERNDYLSKFKFKLIKRSGKHYVIITTRKPFKEPYASFIVEAVWGSGHLLREYTMLVDPPEFVKAQSRPVPTVVASRSSQVKRTTKKSSQTSAKKSSSDYVLSPSDSSSQGGAGSLTYGPTKRNDTLWTIAKNMAPANVSVEQMMMALLRDNPEAFVGNNVNNLKSGYVLRIKDSQSLNQINKSTAYRQAREQYQTWKEIRKQRVNNANIVDRSDRGSDDNTGDEGRLELVASGRSDASSAQGELGAQAKQLKEKLALAGEELQSKEIENQELRERIKELEEIVKTKSSLVELKDETLAALQKQKEMQAQQKVAEMVPDAPVPVAVPVTDTVVDGSQGMGAVETAVSEIIVPETAVSETTLIEEGGEVLAQHIDPSVKLANDELASAALEAKPVVEPVVEPVPVAKVEKVKPKPELKKPEPKPEPEPVKQPAPAPEEDIVNLLMGEYLPYTAGSGAFLIALLAWLGLRGRGKKESDFEESILDSKLSSDESDFEIEDSEFAEADSNTEVLASDTETSFLSDFSSDDMESLQPDDTEADPVSEADVFMVYGRYQQAEELLKNSIKTEPERLDYQMKLLEVYHGDNQKDSFAVQADSVRGLLKQKIDDYKQTTEWTKAVSWAEKLNIDIDMPDSFEEGIPGSLDSTDSPELSLDDSPELSLDDSPELSLDDSPELSLDDSPELSLDDSPEPSLVDIDNDLSLESEEINFNKDSILGDASEEDDFDLSFEDSEDSTNEDTMDLSLEDMDTLGDISLDSDTDKSLEADEVFDINLDELDSDDGDKADDSDTDDEMFDLDASSLESDSFDLEDLDESSDSLELEEIDESSDSLELEEIDESSDSLELEAIDEPSDSLELEAIDESSDSLELEKIDESSDSLELEAIDEPSDSLELEDIDETAIASDDSLTTAESSLTLVDTAEDSLTEADGSLAAVDDELDLLEDNMDFDELGDDFPELDAIGTKLDLAKAYIDMGDMDSASSILNEVVDEGDEEQQSQAHSLLSQTGT